MKDDLRMGLGIALILFVVFWIFKFTLIYPWFMIGAILSFWQTPGSIIFNLTRIIITPLLLLVLVWFLGRVARSGIVFKAVRCLMPKSTSTIAVIAESIFEKKTGIKALYFVRVKLSLGGDGFYIGAVTNEEKDDKGRVWCTVCLQTTPFVATGFTVILPQDELDVIEGYKLSDLFIFFTSYGVHSMRKALRLD